MRKRCSIEFSETTHVGWFFSGRNKPFILLLIPFVCTFIGYNTPFVKNKRSSGFTLVELMITLAVASILAAIAVPSFRNLMASQRQTDFINNLSADLGLARSEALKRSIQVGICSSTDQTTCAASTTWTSGWIVWLDSDNGSDKDVAEQIVKVGSRASPNLAVTTSVTSLIYSREGFLEPNTTIARFKFCDNRGTAYAAAIAVDGVGRPSIERPLVVGVCP